MKVTLTHYTFEPISAIEEAASNCYNSTPTDGKIAKSCYSSGHTSVFEFADFTFHIEGVSRALMAELTRHRHSSFAIRSQRYVNEHDVDWVVPDTIKNNTNAYNVYANALDCIEAAYDDMVSMGIAKEDARFILPNACPTIIECKMNARALINFMNLRLCTRAQWEIRKMAQLMKEEVLKVAPQLAYALVPKCEVHAKHPFCTEHKCCGRHPKLADVYNGPDKSKNQSKYIFLIVGESGSGKTTIVEYLHKKYGYTTIESYTTRPKRHDNETGHIFVSQEEFDKIKLDGMCGYTMFNGYEYCATSHQIDMADLYVIDVSGVEYFKTHYVGNKIPKVVYISATEQLRCSRMLGRGDSNTSAVERLENDHVAFKNVAEIADIVIANNNNGVENAAEAVHKYMTVKEQ